MQQQAYAQVYTDAPKFLPALQEICTYIDRNSYKEPDELLKYPIRRIVDFTGASAGTIRLSDIPSRSLLLRASYGISKKYSNAKKALPVGSSIAGLALEREQIYTVEDLTENSLYRSPEYPIGEGVRSVISIPLLTHDDALGVLSIYYPEPKSFSEREIGFYSVLASHLAGSLNRYILHHRLQESYRKTTKLLVRSLEEKDGYTVGHSERVEKLAIAIARAMELPAHKIKIISDVSVLHDIGKIIIDSSILHKPDALDGGEWQIVREHPVVGTNMLAHMIEDDEGISVIRHHHERVDGSGYPDGLKANSIPIEARIIAVADAYDAMTSYRPYRDKLTREQVRAELKKHVGTQFDGKVVETLLELV